MRRTLILAGLIALAACSTQPEPKAGPPPAPPPETVAPPVAPVKPDADTCGAGEFQSLIGRPRTEIPVPVRPDRRRVVCTTCPMTRDFDQNRLNFFFDAQTGLITAVRCG